MKKIITLLLVILIQIPVFASYVDKQLKGTKQNAKYGTTQIHKQSYQQTYNNTYAQSDSIKDPKLIKLSEVKTIDKNLYSAKLKKDEEIYNSTIKKSIYKKQDTNYLSPDSVDFYAVYRIAERLIRANNLDYINWRIAIRKSEDFNAASFEGNYIRINTALYDTLYDNEDALAFVIGHEIAHHLFGHSQRKADRIRTNKLLCVPYAFVPGFSVWKDKMDVNEDRMMEYMADAEAFKLLVTAGFSQDKAMEALTFMEGLPNMKTIWSNHPLPQDRIASIKETMLYADPNWTEIGKYNIYTSPVLSAKKSSDRVSIVINSNPKPNDFYEPETAEHYITRIAYMSYKNGDMENASKYFHQLTKTNGDYISYLYLSYANENLYKKTKDEKYLKRSYKAIQNAKDIAPQDKHVCEQYNLLQSNL